jgi:hypothetical protein
MTFRTFVHEGVRGVQLDGFGAGSITVEPGPRDDAVEGSLNVADDEAIDDIAIRQDLDQLRISMPPALLRATPVQLRLSVPAGLDYQIHAGSAMINFAADAGRAKISSGSGDVRLGSVAEVECSTGSGSIGVGRLAGRGGRFSTGSGDIRVAEAHCPVSAKSGSGDIMIASLDGADFAGSTGSGDIAVPSAAGSVDLRSASGSLTVGVADDLPVWLDLHSITGAVRIALEASPEPAPGERYITVRAHTASGEIAVYRA